MTEGVHTYLVIRQLNAFGGDFSAVGECYFFVSFVLLLASLTIKYIHRLKFKRNKPAAEDKE